MFWHRPSGTLPQLTRHFLWAGRICCAVGLLAIACGLSGCGADLSQTLQSSTTDDGADAVPGRLIRGNVHGGVYPIQGATIRLMQTQSNGYGGAALSLLSTTSDQNGDFSFPDSGWTCKLGQFAYITVTSGYTINLGTKTNNNDVIQVGVIGPCSALQTTAQIDAINVFVSELSTVAAAYALGNFISIDSTNAASGQQIVNISAPANNLATGSCTVSSAGAVSACTGAGLMHGFSLAALLVNSVNLTGSFPTGQAQFTNSNIAYSSIPAPMINTLGDILQTCVDSVGGSQCSSLFSNATSSTGTVPTNTLQAAMNMAKNPMTNVSALYNLISPTPPFTPALASAPPSLTVSIFYGVYVVNGTASSIVPYPIDVALDAADDAYVLYASGSGSGNTYTAVDEFNAVGKIQYTGAQNKNYLYPTHVTVDASSDVYVTNDDPTSTNDYLLMAASGKSGALQPVAQLAGAYGVMSDLNSNVWVSSASTSTASISQYTMASLTTALATNSSTFASATPALRSGTLGASYGLAMDTNQNVWGTGVNSSGKGQALYWANSSASTTTPVYAAAGGTSSAFTYTAPFSVAASGANAAYYPFNDELTSAAYSTSLSAPNNKQIATTTAIPDSSEVDGLGNVFWTDRETTGLLSMYTPPSSGDMSGGKVISFMPCFAYATSGSYNCITDSNKTSTTAVYSPAYFRGLAIDSDGNIWYVADAGVGAIVETLGVAAPTYPLLAYGHPGVRPQ